MNKFCYYLILVVTFFALWAIMIALFVVLEEHGYKPGSVSYYAGFIIIFGIIGKMKAWLRKRMK